MDWDMFFQCLSLQKLFFGASRYMGLAENRVPQFRLSSCPLFTDPYCSTKKTSFPTSQPSVDLLVGGRWFVPAQPTESMDLPPWVAAIPPKLRSETRRSHPWSWHIGGCSHRGLSFVKLQEIQNIETSRKSPTPANPSIHVQRSRGMGGGLLQGVLGFHLPVAFGAVQCGWFHLRCLRWARAVQPRAVQALDGKTDGFQVAQLHCDPKTCPRTDPSAICCCFCWGSLVISSDPWLQIFGWDLFGFKMDRGILVWVVFVPWCLPAMFPCCHHWWFRAKVQYSETFQMAPWSYGKCSRLILQLKPGQWDLKS